MPRPVVVLVWGTLLIWLVIGYYAASLENPEAHWLRNFYVGALGGSGYNAWMATLALAFLTLEVIVMIFTLRSNQARIERAEQRAKQEAEQRGQQMVAATHQAWAGWNERRMAAEQAGQLFTEPPPAPPAGRNGSSPETPD